MSYIEFHQDPNKVTTQHDLIARYRNGRDMGEMHRALNSALDSQQIHPLPSHDIVSMVIDGRCSPPASWVTAITQAWGIEASEDQTLLNTLSTKPLDRSAIIAPDPVDTTLRPLRREYRGASTLLPRQPLSKMPTPTIKQPTIEGKATSLIDLTPHVNNADAKQISNTLRTQPHNRCYVSAEAVQSWLNGTKAPEPEHIKALATAYNFSDDLVKQLKDQDLNAFMGR